ncbi:extracellular matrix protein 2 [Boleophthalmus pectinirostris]|uniref:extracellular matrix protein 2 n=1 Tax=Boleophthalmus pectinirostris TaxID=150288 RepID=UPI00242DC3F6|nr:extracellular matrix protein 2 [Boleophthalmus pectinirostris]
MELLTLMLVLPTIYAQPWHVLQAGQVKTRLTELEDALLAGKEEVRQNFNAGLNPDIKLHSNEASEVELTAEAQAMILGKTDNSYSTDEDYDDTQRLVREEEESMLVAGLHLDKKRERTAKNKSSLISSNNNGRTMIPVSSTHVPLTSAHLSSPDIPSNPTEATKAIGDVKSESFLEHLLAEVLLIPTHTSTMEVNKGHGLMDLRIHTGHSEDSIKQIGTSTGPAERTFTYNTQAAMLSSTETQPNVPQVTTTVKTAGNAYKPETKDKNASSKALIKTLEKNVPAQSKSPKKTTIKKTDKNYSNAQTQPQDFPYFLDNYCPPECACYGRVVQCSDKGMDRVPYGIPYNSRYVLLMNNHIDRIQLDLLSEYSTLEFLALTNNRLTDGAIEGAFEGVPALKRLYLDTNQLQRVPNDLPTSLEELRLDNNKVEGMSETAWTHCPGLLILSMSNNSLGNDAQSLPKAVLSSLCKLRTLNLDHNQLTLVPLGLPLSIKELYLKGNHIEEFHSGAFNGKSELVVLDLSKNRLTNKGLRKDSLVNATHLESLNLEGNRLKQIPQHLPLSLKTLSLESNLITSIKKMAFGALKNLEHLGLARNKIFKVAVGAFRTLPVLHQLDLGHNALRQVPRQLSKSLHSVSLTHNRIQEVPRDSFCWGNTTLNLSGLVQVQLHNNPIDLSHIDTQAFRCLRGFQVVHFY